MADGLDYARREAATRYSAWAVASVVCAGVSVLPCGVAGLAWGGPMPVGMGVLAWLVPGGAMGALVCGVVGVLRCARARGQVRGEWMAVVGMVVGGLVAGIGGVIVVASVVRGRW
jgi:hypothetical protein